MNRNYPLIARYVMWYGWDKFPSVSSSLFLLCPPPVTAVDLRGDSEPALTADGPEDVLRDGPVN